MAGEWVWAGEVFEVGGKQMTKNTIARRRLLDGYKYVLTSQCQYHPDKFYFDLNEAETEMMKYQPGSVWVEELNGYVNQAKNGEGIK